MSSGGGLVKIAGVNKARLRDFFEIDVDPAAWDEFTKRRNGALLGIGIAEDRDMRGKYVWKAGAEFAMADFDGLTLYFAGTFTPKDPTMKHVIITGDEFLQDVDNRRGKANQILVRIDHRDRAQEVADGIAALDAPIKLHTESRQVALDQAIRDLDEMLRYATYVVIAVGIVILLGLANATSMSVRDRVREVGVLRSIGFSRRKIVALIAGETFLLALAGGALGCLAGWFVVIVRQSSIPVGSYSFPVTLGVHVAVIAVAAAAAVGLFGGLPAGILASRRAIVDSLRSVD